MATYQYSGRRACTNWTHNGEPAIKNLSQKDQVEINVGDIVTSKIPFRTGDFVKIDDKNLTLAKAQEKIAA